LPYDDRWSFQNWFLSWCQKTQLNENLRQGVPLQRQLRIRRSSMFDRILSAPKSSIARRPTARQ
jgi:hypothetical protein